MRKQMMLFLTIAAVIFTYAHALAAEEVKLISYYPAPYGVYQTLRTSRSLSKLNSNLLGLNNPINATNVTLINAVDTHVNLGWVSTTGQAGIEINYCTVSGGNNNTASGTGSTISGGDGNTVSGQYAVIGGGQNNTATPGLDSKTSASWATIGGGLNCLANEDYTTVAGGRGNQATRQEASVCGGFANVANADDAFIGGGEANNINGQNASGGGNWSVISGGNGNKVVCSFIGVGQFSTIGGGNNNIITPADGTVLGATISGGQNNTANGLNATVPGGSFNKADGNYSLAAGRRAQALHNGSFVWADSTDADYSSTGDNQFRVRASGGSFFSGRVTLAIPNIPVFTGDAARDAYFTISNPPVQGDLILNLNAGGSGLRLQIYVGTYGVGGSWTNEY